MAAALFLCTLPQKSSNYRGGGARRVPAATLTSVSLGGLLLNGPWCQLLTPLGFGPCGLPAPEPVAQVYLTGVVVQ